MPRPHKRRFVTTEPAVTYYKPRGIPASSLEEVILTVDELEALRYADHMGLPQAEAAQQLNVSQPTFHRILRSARNKTADALVNGKALRIHGGSYELPITRWFECFQCYNHWEMPFGTGRPQYCPRCKSPNIHRLAQLK